MFMILAPCGDGPCCQGVASSFSVLYNDSVVPGLPSAMHLLGLNLLRMAAGANNATSDEPTVMLQAWPTLTAIFNGYTIFGSIIMVGMAISTMAGTFATDLVKDKEVSHG